MTTKLTNKIHREVMPLIVETKKFEEIIKLLGGIPISEGYQILTGNLTNTLTSFQNGETTFGIYIEGKNTDTIKKKINYLQKRF